ncbi:hypothetical protein RI129_009983 [Pyrocoelia pectoralis]|uniref:Uncharacterized protein n=1 Tax=Pyrocoelia pectoralis TaxID=417401 RepID=A0AAN7ZJ11_9COLE
MPLNQQELLKVAVQLSEERNLQVTIVEFGKSAWWTLGSIFGAWNGRGKFKSVATVILEEMTPMQREDLINSIRFAFGNVSCEDAVELTTRLIRFHSSNT